MENQEMNMHQEMIDSLTRALAAPAGGLMGWRKTTTLVVAGVWGMVNQGMAHAQAAPAQLDPSCDQVELDGLCPAGAYKREQPENLPPLPNGCEPAGGKTKIKPSYGAAQFTAACNAYDSCYAQCDKLKSSCDGSLNADMIATCNESYAGTENKLKRRACRERATAYSKAVAKSSSGAWETAQIENCECCKSKVYCFCNKKCYDNGSQCTSECKASLACNTGICQPATPDQCPP